jgi:hypothetical protein
VPCYDSLRDLDVVVEDGSFSRLERRTSSGFDRVTTVVELGGAGVTGFGEDVTYETAHHDALQERGPWDLAGEYTLGGFSQRLDDRDLFPDDPERAVFRNYRRWAVESAALDLALRQAETTLGERLDRVPHDPHFVVSTSLDENPDRVRALLDAVPDLEFKLDPTVDWSDALVADLAATGAVRVLDMKDQYGDVEFTDTTPATLYDRLVTTFPDAVIEDPAVTAETSAILDDVHDRVSWDAPIHGVDDVERLPWEPAWLNVKPSRFGSIESLCAFLDYAAANDISLYGGGQFELGVGRTQIQELAALFYPDGPNDVAPGVYNDPEVPENPPTPPIEIPENRVGFGWTPT